MQFTGEYSVVVVVDWRRHTLAVAGNRATAIVLPGCPLLLPPPSFLSPFMSLDPVRDTDLPPQHRCRRAHLFGHAQDAAKGKLEAGP